LPRATGPRAGLLPPDLLPRQRRTLHGWEPSPGRDIIRPRFSPSGDHHAHICLCPRLRRLSRRLREHAARTAAQRDPRAHSAGRRQRARRRPGLDPRGRRRLGRHGADMAARGRQGARTLARPPGHGARRGIPRRQPHPHRQLRRRRGDLGHERQPARFLRRRLTGNRVRHHARPEHLRHRPRRRLRPLVADERRQAAGTDGGARRCRGAGGGDAPERDDGGVERRRRPRRPGRARRQVPLAGRAADRCANPDLRARGRRVVRGRVVQAVPLGLGGREGDRPGHRPPGRDQAHRLHPRRTRAGEHQPPDRQCGADAGSGERPDAARDRQARPVRRCGDAVAGRALPGIDQRRRDRAGVGPQEPALWPAAPVSRKPEIAPGVF